jgi:hypothetical protein
MNARRSLLATFCLLACALALAGCYGNSNYGPPITIGVSFSTPPPTSISPQGSFQLTADVTNGPSNAMVNWSCTPMGACGSFQPTATVSGSATTYTAPMTAPAGNSVTISAVSVNDMTKAASANVTIGQPAVTFNAPAPPPSMTTGGVAQVSATINSTVPNEVSDGLDWTATCNNTAGSGCGMFSLAHTNSGIAMSYTAPPTAPAGGVAVTIKAASTLSPGDNVTAVILVSSTPTSAFLCAGCTYTYTVSGSDSAGPFALAGVFTADGTGGITGGEQDFSDFTFTTGNIADSILSAGSSYQFTSDGRGTITLVINDPNVGVSNGTTGTETLGVAFVSPNHLLITELDQSATASGTIDMQTVHSFTPSTLSGGYAFVFGGASIPTNISAAFPVGFGGVFNVNSPGTISGGGSTCDINAGGAVATQQSLNGSFTVSDQLGRIQLTIHSGAFGAVGFTGPMILDGYITDATHVDFVEVDQNLGVVSSGLAVGQGAATGTLKNGSVLPANSSYVFATFGSSTSGPIAFATTYTSDGSSKLQNGASDVNDSGVHSGGIVSGNYSVDQNGTGRVGVTLTGNVPGNTAVYAVYLSGGTDPAMVLEIDKNFITSGAAYTQAAGPFSLSSFKGPYGLNFTLFTPTGSAEVDVSGQVFADGGGNLLGTMDINDNGSPQQNQAFTGGYAAASSGRFTGSITIQGSPPVSLGVSYYIISPTQLVFIETDEANDVSLGLFQSQTPPF